jgi:hypothetical protein
MATIVRSRPSAQRGVLTPTRAMLLTLCLSLLPAELFTVGAAGLYFFYVLQSGKPANALALKLCLPFLLMAAYAILLSGDNNRYDMLKDGWYALKLCLCLALGCLIGYAELDSKGALKALVAFSVVTSLMVIAAWLVFGITPMAPGETEGGFRLPLVAVVAVPVLLERIRAEQRRGFLVAQLGIVLFGVLVSDSRITIIAAAVMVIAWTGSLANTRKAALGAVVVLVVGAAIWQLLPEYNGGPLTVAAKLRRSLDEVLLTDGFDPNQMLLNWRGYEAFNAQLMFDRADLGRKLFGHGLGATVDLGTWVDIGNDEPLRYLPILHNGFYNILIKYGILGVGIYVFAVVRLALLGLSTQGRGLLEDRLLRGVVIVILLSTAVITGLYNKSVLHSSAVITGWLIGLLSHYRRVGAERQLPVVRRPSTTSRKA